VIYLNNDDVIHDLADEIEALQILVISIENLMQNGANRDTYLPILIEEQTKLDKLSVLLLKLQAKS
jgi:hypothetical protein